GPFADVEVAIKRAAAAGSAAGARHAQEVQVVLQRRHAGLAGRADVLLDHLDLCVTAGEAHHDAGKALPRHVLAGQVERQYVHRDAVAAQPALDPPDRLPIPGSVLALDPLAVLARDVLDATLRRPGQLLIRYVPHLVANVHARFCSFLCSLCSDPSSRSSLELP